MAMNEVLIRGRRHGGGQISHWGAGRSRQPPASRRGGTISGQTGYLLSRSGSPVALTRTFVYWNFPARRNDSDVRVQRASFFNSPLIGCRDQPAAVLGSAT